MAYSVSTGKCDSCLILNLCALLLPTVQPNLHALSSLHSNLIFGVLVGMSACELS